MRAREFVREVVDIGSGAPAGASPTFWSSTKFDPDVPRSRGVDIGTWKDPTGADVRSEFRRNLSGAGTTDVRFNRTDATGTPTMGITGTGGGQSSKILSGVVSNIQTFLDKNPDQTKLTFRSQEPSRTKLYSRMIDRIAPQLGLVGAKTDIGKGAAEFSLSRANPGEIHTPMSASKIKSGGGSGGVGAADTRDMQMGADLDPKAMMMRNK
jgi:hypothetical protein